MAVVREHIVDGGGNIVEMTGAMGDDDGAPPMVPGLRVHTSEDVATAGTRPMSEEELAQFGATLPKPRARTAKEPKTAKAKPKPAVAPPEAVSDRRRCLELAVASGETDPAEVLAIAERYLEFLTEE